MSIPLWNRNVPGPAIPFWNRPSWKIVRGSPKFARIGCCLLNGLTGQGYAAAPVVASSDSAVRPRMRIRRRRTGRKTGRPRPRLAGLPDVRRSGAELDAPVQELRQEGRRGVGRAELDPVDVRSRRVGVRPDVAGGERIDRAGVLELRQVDVVRSLQDVAEDGPAFLHVAADANERRDVPVLER